MGGGISVGKISAPQEIKPFKKRKQRHRIAITLTASICSLLAVAFVIVFWAGWGLHSNDLITSYTYDEKEEVLYIEFRATTGNPLHSRYPNGYTGMNADDLKRLRFKQTYSFDKREPDVNAWPVRCSDSDNDGVPDRFPHESKIIIECKDKEVVLNLKEEVKNKLKT